MNKKTLAKILRGVGYVAFFVVALLLFVRLTFPTDQARELARSVLKDKLGAERVDIADLSIGGFILPSGVTVSGVEIDLAPIKVKTFERGVDVDGPPRMLEAEELSISGSLFGLLGGSIDAEIEGKVQGGTLSDTRVVFERGQTLSLASTLTGIELGSESLFQTLTGFDIIATLSGQLKLDVPTVDDGGRVEITWSDLVAEIGLELADATIVQPIIDTVMNREPVRMAFTNTSLGVVRVKLKAEGPAAGAATAAGGTTADAKARRAGPNVIAIEELSAEGGHIEIALAPKATLTLQPGQSLKDAVLNVHLAVRIDDGWFEIEEKDHKDPTKMTKPNIGVRTMLSMGALKAFTQDGQFGVGLVGPLSRLKPQLERPRTRVGGTGAGPGGARRINVDHPGGEDEENGDEPSRPTASPSKSSAIGAEPTKRTPPPLEEPRARPVAAPPSPAGMDRPGRTPITRPTPVSRGVPGGNLDRPRPKIQLDPLAPGLEPDEGDEIGEPHAPPAEVEPLVNGDAPPEPGGEGELEAPAEEPIHD
jgi:type II secretion system protein N